MSRIGNLKRGNSVREVFLIRGRASLLLAIFLLSLSLIANAETNWKGWAVCNLGIYLNHQDAAAAASQKAQELWPEPDRRVWSYMNYGPNERNQPWTNYLYPYSNVPGSSLSCTFCRDSHSYVACHVRVCPTGYTEIDGKCFLNCGPGEVRGPDNACICPEGGVCPDQDLGPPDCGSGEPSSGVGNPVNASTGNKYQVETDYVNPSNPLLRIRRVYNSQSRTTGMFGRGWSWDFGGAIGFAPAADPAKLRVLRPDGRNYYFQSNQAGSSSWTPLSDTRDSVSGWASGWTYRVAQSGIKETYDRNSRLTSISDNDGHSLQFLFEESYGNVYPDVPQEHLAKVVDHNGRTLTLAYDSSKRIKSITESGGGTYSYVYDSSGRLISVTFPGGAKRIYRYNESAFTAGVSQPYALTGIENEAGIRLATWTYDASGRATSSAHHQGADHTGIVYNADGSTTVTNALGKQTTYLFETIRGSRKVNKIEGHASANCVAANKEYTYYGNGTVQSKTDWSGNVTTYIRDSLGREISRTEAYGTPQARTILTEYHPSLLNKPVKIIEPGLITEMTYDASGRLLNTKKTATEQ